MCPVEGIEELGAGDLRIDLGSGQALVAQEFLHEADVRAALQEMRGAGMAQLVAGDGLHDAGLQR